MFLLLLQWTVLKQRRDSEEREKLSEELHGLQQQVGQLTRCEFGVVASAANAANAPSAGSRLSSSSQLSDLQQQGAAERSRLEQQVSELETRLEEQQPSADVAAEVRRCCLHLHLRPNQLVSGRGCLVEVPGCVCVCVLLQVKRVMNGVFHSLRGEFEVGESYNGQAVLGIIVTTIKVRR